MKEQKNPDAVFHALGEATRRGMVVRLSEGPLTVSELAQPLAISLAAVVQHLRVLEEAGLVTTTKQGRVRTCRLSTEGLGAAAEWIGNLRALWERRLDRLGEFLEEEDGKPAAG